MKSSIQTNRGFIVLLVIIPLTVITVASIWYLKVSNKQTTPIKTSVYQKYIDEKTTPIDQNGTATTTAEQSEIEQLKQEVAALKRRQISPSQNTTKAFTPIPSAKQEFAPKPSKAPEVQMEQKNYTITSSELSPYITGVIEIGCGFIKGSGSLWKSKLIVTNAHVVEQTAPDGSCVVYSNDAKGDLQGIYKIYPKQNLILTKNGLDAAIVSVQPADSSLTEGIPTKPIAELNYNISSLPSCDPSSPIGSPVVVIGYPSSGKTSWTAPDGITGTFSSRIITNGIISGYAPKINSKYANYFVSAKIDSGNSGGIALSKNANGLCVLGIPTWLNIGNYDTQGMIQNIHNIMYRM